MNLDRREKHVLSELWERFSIPTSNLMGKMVSKQIGVLYLQSDDKVRCRIIDDLHIAYGLSVCSPKEKNSFPVGRMIAFSRAILEWLNRENEGSGQDYSLTSKQLEDIARGNDNNSLKKFVSNRNLSVHPRNEDEAGTTWGVSDMFRYALPEKFWARKKKDQAMRKLGSRAKEFLENYPQISIKPMSGRHYKYTCKVCKIGWLYSQDDVKIHLRYNSKCRVARREE